MTEGPQPGLDTDGGQKMFKMVFFGRSYFQYNGFDSMKMLLNDVMNTENFYYVGTERETAFRWLNYFYMDRIGSSIKKRVGIPFRRKAYRDYMQYHKELNRDDEICFVFVRYEEWFFGEDGFLKYLKETYPKSQLFYLVLNVNRYLHIDFDTFRPCFDRVITIDKGDAEEYGLDFYPFFYSPVDVTDSSLDESDCFFVGNAKSRIGEILKVYKLLSESGLRCDFHIVEVPPEQQLYKDKIVYNKPMNYDEVVCHVKKTKMLLEIMQEGQTCGTLREHEAVIYGKKLLTNNKCITERHFYSEKYISVFEDPEEIDRDFVTDLDLKVSYEGKELISPERFVDYARDLMQGV